VTLVYAIVQARGRQIKVTPGAVVEIDGVPGEQGSSFEFAEVLLVEKDAGDIFAGAPFVANAKVLGVVDGEARGPKLRVFKKKRRKGFRKTRGHRSFLTRVRITDIQV
jgi:large subunit ribosomal protein L21